LNRTSSLLACAELDLGQKALNRVAVQPLQIREDWRTIGHYTENKLERSDQLNTASN